MKDPTAQIIAAMTRGQYLHETDIPALAATIRQVFMTLVSEPVIHTTNDINEPLGDDTIEIVPDETAVSAEDDYFSHPTSFLEAIERSKKHLRGENAS